MTDPATEPGYLESAAAELRKARDANEARATELDEMETMKLSVPPGDRQPVNDRRMEIAEAFTRLAAIEAGLPPCCHRARPEQEQES